MWLQVSRTVLQSLISMGAALLTETFLKQALVVGLEKLVKRTATDADDKLLAAAKKSWGMGDQENGG